MDTCHYCGRRYHPMPVYTVPGARIHVCHHKIVVDPKTNEIDFVDTECRERAEKEGYTYRRDLTPRR